MATKKPIDKQYLIDNLKLFEGHTLYATRTITVIDVPESYTVCTSTDVGAILVDSTNINAIQVFLPDITLGEYVLHTDEQSHDEEITETKYIPRTEGYTKAEVDALLQNVIAGEIGDLYVAKDDENFVANTDARHIHVEYTEDEINELFDVTEEEYEQQRKLINDTITSTEKTYSSQYIKTLLADSEIASQEYAEKVLADASFITTNLASDISEVLAENTIYLIDNGTGSKDMYMLIGGSATSIGTTTVDLTTVYSKTESDNKFLTKTDADLKYATITAVDGKSDKGHTHEIADVTYLQDTLDAKVEGTLVTALTEDNVDTEVPSAKATYDYVNDMLSGGDVLICPVNESPKEFALANCTGNNSRLKFSQWITGSSTTIPADSAGKFAEYEFIRGTDSKWSILKAIVFTSSTTNLRVMKYCLYNGYATSNPWGDWITVGEEVTNPNLLDNPWFTINQRGQSSYSGTKNYFAVDRWRFTPDLTVTVNSDKTITVTNNGTSKNWFGQKFYLSDSGLSGGEIITQSIMLADGTIYSHTATIPTSATVNDKEINENGIATIRIQKMIDEKYHAVYYVSAGSSVTIKALKLERGAVSTIANDYAPNYSTELVKCKRYYQRYTASANGYFRYGFAIGTNTIDTQYIFDVPMIADPSVKISDATKFKYNNFDMSFASATYFTESPETFNGATGGTREKFIRFKDSVNSPFTVGQTIRIGCDAGAYIEFVADI